jgi:hypothetical protein
VSNLTEILIKDCTTRIKVYNHDSDETFYLNADELIGWLNDTDFSCDFTEEVV